MWTKLSFCCTLIIAVTISRVSSEIVGPFGVLDSNTSSKIYELCANHTVCIGEPVDCLSKYPDKATPCRTIAAFTNHRHAHQAIYDSSKFTYHAKYRDYFGVYLFARYQKGNLTDQAVALLMGHQEERGQTDLVYLCSPKSDKEHIFSTVNRFDNKMAPQWREKTSTLEIGMSKAKYYSCAFGANASSTDALPWQTFHAKLVQVTIVVSADDITISKVNEAITDDELVQIDQTTGFFSRLV